MIKSNLIEITEWADYYNNSIEGSFYGYLDCTDHTTEYIEKLLATVKTFDELKNELSNFVLNRKEFRTTADAIIDGMELG